MHKSAPQSDINDHRDSKKSKPHLHEAFNFKMCKIIVILRSSLTFIHSFVLEFKFCMWPQKEKERERDRNRV